MPGMAPEHSTMAKSATAMPPIDRTAQPDESSPTRPGTAATHRTAAPLRRSAPLQAAARPRRFWIAVVAQDSAAALAAGGYLQLGSGRAGPLERMAGGDGFVLYSPRASASGNALQAFTAIGRVRDAPIEIAGGEAGGAFRRAAEYLPATVAPIRPLIPALTFIRNPAQWGAAFRFGVVRIPDADFAHIARAMGRACEIDFPDDTGRFAPVAYGPAVNGAPR
jgi:hypothetical protein